MKILVTGGCGYIGSHTIVDLIENGYDIVSIDSNIRSNPNVLDGVEQITGKSVKNYAVDLCDLNATRSVFEVHQDIEGVIHFAAFKSVKESIDKPLLYHKNNLLSLINVLECVKLFDIKNFVFSSSCSVYGNIERLPATEDTPQREAQSPYTRTKQISEMIIKDFALSNPITNSIILRYFNPAGAHISNRIGESSYSRPMNLIPVIVETASGKRNEMCVYGDDYDTRDGSCIRDFIHIMDLANAHTKALKYLVSANIIHKYDIFNLGAGEGVTVFEMVQAFEKVTGKKLKYKVADRRPGDVIAIYSNYNKAFQKLGWSPQYDIEDIMCTAWAWETKTI